MQLCGVIMLQRERERTSTIPNTSATINRTKKKKAQQESVIP